MNVLSLYDGISCGMVALERANIKVDKYYAAEIDKYATKISEANYPSIIRMGDVTKWQDWNIDWDSIDLVLAGFPCQAWSMAGQQQGDKDPRGALFWTTLDIISNVLKHNPKAKFLMENVKMKKEFEDYITHHTEQALGYVEKTLINSALVSAQNRNRFYWTNFKVTQPEDKGILLRDVIDYSLSDQFYRPCKLLDKPTKGGHVANATDIKGNESIKRIYTVNGKSPTLTTMGGGHREPKILIDRKKSYCVDANYAKGGNPDQYFTKKRRQLIFLENNNEILYRKLTPLECERLQTMLQYIKSVEIVLCYDQVKSFVSAVEKNHKLLKLVSSVESDELKGYVKLASQSTSASQVPTRNTAQQSADMTTQKQTEKCTNTNQDEQSLDVNSVEKFTMCRQAGSEASSAAQSAFISITEGKITHFGKGELHQTEQSYTEQMSGKVALNLFGNEMMQSAKDVLSALEMMQTNRHSTSITSFRLSTKNLEQMLIISYWFAKDAIVGFTHGTTKTKTLYLHLIDGYTTHVSNTQRYKSIGNGWTVDVIAHILRGAF